MVKRGLNVRQTEKLAKKASAVPRAASSAPQKDSDTIALERDLSNLLGLEVEIKFRGAGGSLILHYRSLDQLDEVLQRLSHGAHGGGAPRDASAHVTGDGGAHYGSISDAEPLGPDGQGMGFSGDEDPAGTSDVDDVDDDAASGTRT